eukprot:TRINITY_DN4372_c0_g1_i1.p2 TRINITY_DN4372_c0_g1~~TRINITY_DN4372_c0_g1_i1.p2  ORF type:complete len:62 (-),score=12.74 TRINITY_DN4372_c0_g1_i1:449-634(-)
MVCSTPKFANQPLKSFHVTKNSTKMPFSGNNGVDLAASLFDKLEFKERKNCHSRGMWVKNE